MSDRGMKKWAPYASLIEQKGTIVRAKQQRQRISKPLLSQEAAREINEQLHQANHQYVALTYFQTGQLINLQGFVEQMDFDQKYLIIHKQIIHFKDLTTFTVVLPTKKRIPLFND